ncbi:MAG: roadblock/LC7 domain-containing protein [Promethearchaeota archaeon]
MTVCLDVDLVLDNILKELGSGVYFILITSENGVIIKSYISEEFNKSSIGLNMSQLYELAEEITSEIGIHSPDFNVIHSDNFYILSIKILERIIIILMEDQIDFSNVFNVINECIKKD